MRASSVGSGRSTYARRALVGLLLGFVALLMPHPAAAASAPAPGVPATVAAGHSAPPVATTSRGARISVDPVTGDHADDHTDDDHADAVLLVGEHLVPPAQAAPAVLPGAVLPLPPTGAGAAPSRSPQAPAAAPAHETNGRSPPSSGTA